MNKSYAQTPAKDINWDREWLEKMYNNRANVSESEQFIEKWAQASENARNLLKDNSYLNISYGGAFKETLDIFMPTQVDKNNPPPVLVFIHGGYWYALDKDYFSYLAPKFVNKGACVIIVNYTLCPDIHVTGIVDEITHAMIWIKRNIADYGADQDKITISGHSAGGHLTAMMFTRDWKKLIPEINNPSPFKNGLSISGLFDLEPLKYTPFLEKIKLTDEDVTYSSPVNLPDLMKSSPLYCIAGDDESEEFHRQNKILQQKWGEKQVPVNKAIDHQNHFTIVDEMIKPKSEVNTIVLQLLGIK